MDANLLGVKIGDLSGDLNGRSNKTLALTIADAKYIRGNEYKIDFTAKDFVDIAGFQFTLNFDASALTFVGLEAGDLPNLDAANFGLAYADKGVLTTSWDYTELLSLDDDAVLFSLTVFANSDITAREALKITSEITRMKHMTA